jgi:hypothetical protein
MTSPLGKDFRQHSEEIARKFLQTIMVVDDRAYFEPRESPVKHTKLITPGFPPLTGRSIEDLDEETTFLDESEGDASSEEGVADAGDAGLGPEDDKAHQLNAKKLIEDFAERGVVCAVIRPEDVEVEALGVKVYPLAENSDIVVFDWVLGSDIGGEKVKELIGRITKNSSEEEKRLRLIVVYTGQLNLADITNQIKRALKKDQGLNVKKENPYTLVSGPVRIAVYAKGYVRTPRANEELAARIIPIERMPDTLIGEFTDMTMGLVSNVALQSLAALRSNTHHILSKFHPGIDAPFLSHRAMLKQPGDAGNLLVYLIGAELTAILDGAEVSRAADEYKGDDIIRAWLEKKELDGHTFATKFPTASPASILDDVCKLLRKGIEDDSLREELKAFKKHPHKKELTKKFCDAKASAVDLEHQFAILTSVKSDYRVRPPALMPGTLLKETRRIDNHKKTFYWVCIQPVCDSVRVTERRAFPLLELKVVEENSNFNLVLPERKKGYVHLKTIYSPYRSRMEEFDPSDDGLQMVRAEVRKSGYYFKTAKGKSYQWVAELKFEHAQRIVNEYAAKLSRVGLDESEWLRRWAG